MMKTLRHSILCLMAATAILASCSSDDELAQDQTSYTYDVPEPVSITLGVQDENASSRVDTKDPETGENMYTWFVIAVEKSGNTIAAIASGTASDATQVDVSMNLTRGSKYDFYSFANVTQTEVLGGTPAVGDAISKYITSATTFTVNGNDFDISNHIPMSNVQEDVTVPTSGTLTLWTVRMLAKVELDITNQSGVEVSVNSVTLSNITQNVANGGDANLILLPKNVNGTADGTGYCEPNLASTASPDDYTYKLSSALTLTNGGTGTIKFYVNESEVPSTSTVPYFVITLNTTQTTTTTTSNGGTESTTSTSTQDDRYGVLEWTQIARNDWRVIPITLDDYKLEIIPQDFTAIGQYPASVIAAAGVYTITFHAAGHFHLVPTMTKISTGKTIDYVTDLGTTSDTWTITKWEADSKNADLFETSTDIYDGTDNGGVPVWDENNQYYFGKFKEGCYGTAAYTLSAKVLTTASNVTREYTYKVYLIRPDGED